MQYQDRRIISPEEKKDSKFPGCYLLGCQCWSVLWEDFEFLAWRSTMETCNQRRKPMKIFFDKFWLLGYTWQSWFRYLGPKGRRKKWILRSNIYKPKCCGGWNFFFSCTHKTAAGNGSKNWAPVFGLESINSTYVIAIKSAVVVSASMKTWSQHFFIWASLSPNSNFARACHNQAFLSWGKS